MVASLLPYASLLLYLDTKKKKKKDFPFVKAGACISKAGAITKTFTSHPSYDNYKTHSDLLLTWFPFPFKIP